MGRGRASVLHDPVELQRFTDMWSAGVTAERIGDAFSMDERWVRKWRKKLGLPERGSNSQRAQRVADHASH